MMPILFIIFKKIRLFFFLFFLLFSFVSFAAPPTYLKLETVLLSVQQFYPKIKIAHLEINKSQGEYLSALGKFDPFLNVNSASQPLGGYINGYGDTELKIPTFYNGLKLFGGYRNGQGDWPIYYQNNLTNSGGEYRAGLSFPLLRDRLIDKERNDLWTQNQMIHLKEEDAALIQVKVYQETIKAYWQWVQAGLQVKAFEDLFNLAKKRQIALEKQADQGDLAQLSVTENLQQIIQREQLLNQAKMIFQQWTVNLSLYYRDQKGKPKMALQSDLPSFILTRAANMDSALSELNQHPALKKLSNYSEIIKLKQNLAKNELLPDLEAIAYTAKQNGKGASPLLLPQSATLGLSFKFPLFQREAKGRLISANSELEQIKKEKHFVLEQLKNELNNLLIALKIYHQQLVLANKEVILAEKVKQGESEKFYAGDSTLFLVNQREQISTQTKLNAINTKIKLQESYDMIRFFSSSEPVF